MKQQLKLNELKVKSFVTETESGEKVLGGSPQFHNLMLHDNANNGHYGLVMTSTAVWTRQRVDLVVRSGG